MLRRSVRLGALVVRYLVGSGCRSLVGRLFPMIQERADRDRDLAALFEELGPTFVKIGQLLASRPDLVGPETASRLTRLRNRHKPVEFQEIEAALRDGMRRPLDQVFASVDEAPLGTGSVAQVHRAVLIDGRVVAVKVVKPGVRTRFAADFALLRRAASLIQRLPGVSCVPLTSLICQLEKSVCMQADLSAEASHHRRLQESAREVGVRMPEIIPECSSSGVLVMEFLEGLVELDSPGACPERRRAAAVQGLHALYQMIFRAGFIHADLHPGNVFLSPGGELVFLDCGLVAVLSDYEREQFRQLFWSLATGDGRGCARVLLETAQHRPARLDEQGFSRAVGTLVRHFSQQRVESFEVAAFVRGLFDVQRRFGIRSSSDFVMTVYSLLVFEAVLKTLAPGLNFQREAAAYLLTVPRATGPVDRSAVFAELEAEWSSWGATK